ncbi:MAG: hypothetical protein KC503_06980 [Myxococcales bacterium]|nr:hypothetical protein [Myxococcales bacterium]
MTRRPKTLATTIAAPLSLLLLLASGAAHARSGRRAAIDFGSSSAKLVIVDHKGRVLADLKHSTNFGRGIGKRRLLPKANVGRAMTALRRFVGIARRYGVQPKDIAFIATAATRNADGNGGGSKGGEITGRAFIDQHVKGTLGLLGARVLDGEQEAQLGYRAAISGWTRERAAKKLGYDPSRLLIIDQGGGSHQVLHGDWSGPNRSTQVGSLSVDALLGKSYALGKTSLKKADRALRELVTTPTALLTGGLAKFLRVHFQKDVITRRDVQRLRRRLAGLSKKQRSAAIRRHADGSALSKNELRALGMYGAGVGKPSGRKLPAKMTLLLRVLDLNGIGDKRAKLLLAPKDARHVLVTQW